ncbi:hypothetical protein GW17_00058726 [Ensete ventricosum]|nr:hypothetical protein GW17_00058726 [Ensete ventricosum]
MSLSRGSEDAVGNPPGVRRGLTEGTGACQDGVREFTERRPRLVGRLSGVAERLARSWEGSDDAVGPRWEFARRFFEGIGKLAGNTPGDCQKKIERIDTRMSEATGLAGSTKELVNIRFKLKFEKWREPLFSEISMGKPPVSDGWTTRTLKIGRLSVAESLRTDG